jgi:UDP-GlcNAc:undecaprenyl-phosphate GlcNAc-1-phosphate transferase
MVMAALALALRFVPYSDDHGNFDAAWSAVIAVFGLAAIAASIYLVYVLEILKLRRVRIRQLTGMRRDAGRPVPEPAELDAGVAQELETGSFPAIDPETGELELPPK